MLDKLSIFNIVLSLVILAVVIALVSKLKQQPTIPPIVISPGVPRPPRGGCAGTQFGCCSNGRTPRANPRGTNC